MRLACLLSAVLLATPSAWAFSNVATGEALPEKSLPRLTGAEKQPYLTKAKVSVFFFVSPGTKHGQHALKGIAELVQELKDKPVSWTALVSGGVAQADIERAVQDAGFTGAVLRDDGDALYGALGTALTPVVGVADDKHRLLAYLPFTKLGYQDAIRAWVRFALGELTEQQLQDVLKPPPLPEHASNEAAGRYVKMAQRQQEHGDLDKALASVKKALERDAELPAAHAQLASILAAKGQCAEAAPALDKALKAEPANALALAAKQACAGGAAAPATDAGPR
jgi:tetratricopeptide (TPR) repeat protein